MYRVATYTPYPHSVQCHIQRLKLRRIARNLLPPYPRVSHSHLQHRMLLTMKYALNYKTHYVMHPQSRRSLLCNG